MNSSDVEKQLTIENLNRIVHLIDNLNSHHQLLVDKLENVLLIDGKVVNQDKLDLIQKRNCDIKNEILNNTLSRIN